MCHMVRHQGPVSAWKPSEVRHILGHLADERAATFLEPCCELGDCYACWDDAEGIAAYFESGDEPAEVFNDGWRPSLGDVMRAA